MAIFVYPAASVTIAGGATEAKQDTIIAELQDIDTNTADNATETTLSAVNAKITAVDTTGKATEAKQDTIIAELQDIDANTADAATETTLSALNAKVTAADTGNVTVASSALPTGAATAANQSTANSSLSNIESDINDLNARLAGALVPDLFDYIELTYVAAGNGQGEIETAVYKTGGAAGTTVATLTLAYDASNRLSSVTKS